jgi:putative LysE/RhtB family amino acid efflux pump
VTLPFFFKGALIGLSIAAPVGPIGVLCIRRSLTHGRLLGFVTGSALWWLTLSGGVALLRSRINSTWMQTVNRLSGCIIFAFGLYALAKLLFRSQA